MALAIGDFQYVNQGLLDRSHLRFFTYSTFTKLLLDAGYKPSAIATIGGRVRSKKAKALTPLIRSAGGVPKQILKDIGVYQFIFKGEPIFRDPAPEWTESVSVVSAVNSKSRLDANLLASPDMADHRVQFVPIEGKSSAGEALTEGLSKAEHEIVVLVHQDVYLPRGFLPRFLRQFRDADAMPGGVGVAGVFGAVGVRSGSATRQHFVGRVMDRRIFLDYGHSFPARADTLDEMLLAVKKDTPITFDTDLGWHFYGADAALQAQERGLGVCVLNAPAYHNSLLTTLPNDFHHSGVAFKKKWSHRLPIATSCTVVTSNWPQKKRRKVLAHLAYRVKRLRNSLL